MWPPASSGAELTARSYHAAAAQNSPRDLCRWPISASGIHTLSAGQSAIARFKAPSASAWRPRSISAEPRIFQAGPQSESFRSNSCARVTVNAGRPALCAARRRLHRDWLTMSLVHRGPLRWRLTGAMAGSRCRTNLLGQRFSRVVPVPSTPHNKICKERKSPEPWLEVA